MTVTLRIGLGLLLVIGVAGCRARLPCAAGDEGGPAIAAASPGGEGVSILLAVRADAPGSERIVPPAPPPPPPPSPTSPPATSPTVTRAPIARPVVPLSQIPCPDAARCAPPRSVQGRNFDPLLVRDPMKDYLNAYWGVGPSFLPNVGASVEFGSVYKRGARFIWSGEMKFTWQFLDDEDFIDDGNPGAGNWWQAQGGIKLATNPRARRHWTFRGGGVWFYAEGEPNIVQEPGHYFGVYAGIGFEAEITSNFSTGPELQGLFVYGQDRVFAIPQFTWHFIWSF